MRPIKNLSRTTLIHYALLYMCSKFQELKYHNKKNDVASMVPLNVWETVIATSNRKSNIPTGAKNSKVFSILNTLKVCINSI